VKLLREILDELFPQEMRDDVYLTRARAIELGATHEGSQFGVPCWFWVKGGDSDRIDPEDPDAVIAGAKCGLLEWFISLGCAVHAMTNEMTDGDEPFALLMRPIKRELVP
jgi:hypothetical protein